MKTKQVQTELSKYVWSLMKSGVIPVLSWEIIDYAKPYRNGSKRCNLCLTVMLAMLVKQPVI